MPNDARRVDRPMLIAVLLLASCALALASLGADLFGFALFVPVYLGLHVWAWLRGHLPGHRPLLLFTNAFALGLSLCWIGLFATTGPYGVHPSEPSPPWPDYHPATRAGFPFRDLLGDGGGGAPEFIPLDKGLPILFVNLAACTVAAWLLLWPLPHRRYRQVLVPLVVTAAATSLGAAHYFLYYFD